MLVDKGRGGHAGLLFEEVGHVFAGEMEMGGEGGQGNGTGDVFGDIVRGTADMGIPMGLLLVVLQGLQQIAEDVGGLGHVAVEVGDQSRGEHLEEGTDLGGDGIPQDRGEPGILLGGEIEADVVGFLGGGIPRAQGMGR